MKRKKNNMYLLNTDIEELNKRYEGLYKQVKDNTNLTKDQIARECEVLLEKYNFEIEELCDMREVEYETQRAKIEARNAEQIPWRRGWWWRLIFRPVTNRAQDIIEDEAALDADVKFTDKEKELEARWVTLFGDNVKNLSKRRRRRALKKYLKYKRMLEGDNAVVDVHPVAEPRTPETNTAPTEAPRNGSTAAQASPFEAASVDVADVQSAAEPPEPPARKSRKPLNQGA